jgi:hypothetical protein
MNKPTRRRRAACRAAARTLAIATDVAALVATLGAGQALAGPDERVLERQARIDRQAAAAQADEQAKAEDRSQQKATEVPRRFFRPEPPMDTGPRLDADEQVAPAPAPAPPPPPASDRTGLIISLAVAGLLLARGAATTWRIHHHRRPRPEPTS